MYVCLYTLLKKCLFMVLFRHFCLAHASVALRSHLLSFDAKKVENCRRSAHLTLYSIRNSPSPTDKTASVVAFVVVVVAAITQMCCIL